VIRRDAELLTVLLFFTSTVQVCSSMAYGRRFIKCCTSYLGVFGVVVTGSRWIWSLPCWLSILLCANLNFSPYPYIIIKSSVLKSSTETNMSNSIEQSASAASASNYEGIEIVARDNRADVDPETGVQSEGGDGSANTATAFPSPRHGYYRKSKYAGAVAVLTLLVAAGTGVSIWS